VAHLRTIPVVLLLCLTLAACGGSSGSSASAPATGTHVVVKPPAAIANSGHLVFCSDISYPPEEFYEPGTQTPEGSDIDIGTAIATLMGVQPTFQNTGYNGIISALQGDKCDAIISGMTDTPERAKQVGFIDYLRLGETLMVKKGSTLHFNTLADLSGHSAAAEVSTTEATQMQAESKKLTAEGKKPIDVQIFPTDTGAAAALATGKVDAYFSDTAPVLYHIAQDPSQFQVASPQFYSAPLGIAVRKDDAQLHNAITKAVAAAYADGTMKKILAKWKMPFAALQP
jgi:polar amino acid transport system substrate-binding protein